MGLERALDMFAAIVSGGPIREDTRDELGQGFLVPGPENPGCCISPTGSFQILSSLLQLARAFSLDSY